MLGSAIKNLVIVKMDEYTPYSPTSPLLAGGDDFEQVKPVESYIDQSLFEAANEILSIVPIHKLRYKVADVECIPDANDSCIGKIAVPDDFLRLHTLWMEGWRMPVHSVIHAYDPAYSLQFVRWTRGTKQKPVVTITGIGNNTVIEGSMYDNTHMFLPSIANMDAEGYVPLNVAVDNEDYAHFVGSATQGVKYLLNYYSVDSGVHYAKEFKYIPVFNIETEYEDSVAELIALQCARKVFEVFGNTEQAGVMTSEINSVLDNIRQ